MLRLVASLLALWLSSAVQAIPGPGRSAVRSQLESVPAGFKIHDLAVLPDELIQLTLAIPQANIPGLHAALLDVSDPASPNYGRHLSKQEVEQLVAPRSESVRAVTEWLNSHGVTPAAPSASGGMVNVRMPVKQANALLDADFAMYIHEDTNTTMIRTLSYSLPESLNDHVNLVYPTTQFLPPVIRSAPIMRDPDPSRRRPKRTDAGVPPTCAEATTPRCLQALYNIPTTPASAPNNSLYVSGFGGQVASKDDLQDFLSRYRPDVQATFDVLPVDGASVDGVGTDEANFDIQYAVGLATNVPTTFLASSNRTSGIILQDLVDVLDFLLAQDKVPLVLTTSYLFAEPDVGYTFAHTICDMFAQLGARGTSVIFASGDNGVAGGFLNDPADCEDKPFVPTFPATCPFVTAVGATQDISPEVGASFSSGGFSNCFPRPSYQAGAVQQYTSALGDTYAGRYNSSGRAYPDVSMHGVDYEYNLGGKFRTAWGTSTSAPAFASIVALLNDRLLSTGRSPLGFLNPLLYSLGSDAFNDITTGNNPGCGTDGFQADVGWDPVTGLGTPDFSRLLSSVTGDVVAISSIHTQNAASRTVSWTCMHIFAFLLLVLVADYHYSLI